MLLNFTYPKRCPICGDIVIPTGKLVCDTCSHKPVVVKEPRCKCCSKPLEEEAEFCYDCSSKQVSFERGFSMWVYDSTMKKSIGAFKYNRRKEYVDYYVEELVKRYQDDMLDIHPDVIIPVPIHISKMKQRGFNQAELVARKLGEHLNIQVRTDILVRNVKTTPQKELTNEERLKNLRHAFLVDKEKKKWCKKYRTALLVDDIYTTGSTIESCSRVLREAGLEKVYFITICIGRGL